MNAPAPGTIQRFWSYVDKGSLDECWPWNGGRSPAGYGKFWVDGHTLGAHRFALSLSTPLPKGIVARHTCDNPPCCNPAHLLPGTNAQNVADAIERDRWTRGPRNGRTKLTEVEVRRIHARRAEGATHRGLASEFGVSKGAIHWILSGRNWSHVEVSV